MNSVAIINVETFIIFLQVMINGLQTVTHSIFFWIVLIIAGGYLVIVILMYLLQSSFIYYPTRKVTSTPENIGLPYEDVRLKTSDSLTIHGWFIPAAEAKATLLFFHGNAGNISGRLESIRLFHQMGMNVLIIDYRGYGKSQGVPTEEGTYKDAMAAWTYLTEVYGEKPERIIVFGRSLGGGIASWLATQVQPGALVLEATFTSTVDLARNLYPFLPVRLLLRIHYPAIEYIQNVQAPVMVLHSKNDEIIPFDHGIQLFEQARKPVKWVEMKGGHNDGFIMTGQVYINAWEHFVSENLK